MSKFRLQTKNFFMLYKMNMHILEILTFSLIPFSLTLIGGTLALRMKVSRFWCSVVQHFVAGILLGTVSIELMPEILNTDAPLTTTVAFFLGVFAMMLLHALSNKLGEFQVGNDLPLGAIFASALDLFIDGIILSIAFLAGMETGILVALSLGFCALFLNLNIGMTLRRKPLGLFLKMLIIALVAISFLLGSFVGYHILDAMPGNYLIECLSFGVAALLYLGIEELLVEGHKVKDKIWTPGLFFLGFWMILLFKCVI
jgi:ZIP family zinc transporter